MTHSSIAIAAGAVLTVANDAGGATEALAESRQIRPGGTVTPRRDPSSEVLLFVERGHLELMIDGATTHLAAGDYVRVAPGRVHAYRNAGETVARVVTVRLNAEDRRNFAARLVASVAA